jgi:hypothetical protein
MTGGTDELRLSIAWFETAKPNGPALGNSETTTWSNFASIFATWRREGEKGGLNFVPSRFEMEADGRHVRRQLANVIARTAVALDIETNGKTGEVPPPPEVAAARVQALGHAAVLYTSHNHEKAALRYRIILLLDQEIEPDITAPVFAAKNLDLGRRLRQVQNQQCGAVLSAFMSIRRTRPAPDDRHPRRTRRQMADGRRSRTQSRRGADRRRSTKGSGSASRGSYCRRL